MSEKGQDGQDDQSGSDQGQDDSQINSKLRDSVQAGGIFQIGRQALNKASHQENPDGIGEWGENQSPVRVEKVQVENREIKRDEDRRERNHHRHDHDDEEGVSKREFHFGKRVPGHGVDEDLDQRD